MPPGVEHALAEDQIDVFAFANPEADPSVHLGSDSALAHRLLRRPLGRGNEGYRDCAAEPGDRVAVAHSRGCLVDELGVLVDDDH
jgi:hypothetical protein